MQVLTAGDKGESLSQENGRSLFVQVLVNGLNGMADRNNNGWLMASEVGDYVKQHVLASESVGAVEIVLGNRVLRVRPDFDADMLLELVRLLEEPAC